LASYYTERGETPGAWVGSGVAGVDGLNTGDAVTAEQMRALFGAGMHPLAAMRLEQLDDANLTDASVKAATQMGTPFKVYAGNSRRDVELGSHRLRRSCRAEQRPLCLKAYPRSPQPPVVRCSLR
jgi:TrwC relaxase